MTQRHRKIAERAKNYREVHDDLRRTVYGAASAVPPSTAPGAAKRATVPIPEMDIATQLSAACVARRPGFYRAGPMPSDYRPIELSYAQSRVAPPVQTIEEERTAPEPYWID